MKKKTNATLKIFSVFLFMIFSFSVFTPRANAGICDWSDDAVGGKIRDWFFGTRVYCQIKEINPQVSIQRTIDDGINQMVTGTLLGMTTNASADDFGVCGLYLIDAYGTAIDADYTTVDGVSILGDDSAAILAEAKEIGSTMNCDFNATPLGGLQRTEKAERTRGSLMGLASMGYSTMINEAPPVNLSYYAQRNLQKIPILNQTAYAQEVKYQTWGFELIYSIWNSMKNVAFAMMAVIMLIIGIMIIARKKISAQAVVTVQQALPRVVISIIMITFSYAIGGIFASAILPLSAGVIKLMFSQFLQNVYDSGLVVIEGSTANLVDMNVVVMVYSLIIKTVGPATMALAGIIVMMFLTLIVLIIAVLKILIINMKIMVSVVLAPLQFAIAAIPGQEHLIMDWIKGMVAKTLAIPAIVFIVSLAWYMFLAPFFDASLYESLTTAPYETSATAFFMTTARGTASLLTTLMMLPLMNLMLMFFALRVDKKVEEFIMGPKKR